MGKNFSKWKTNTKQLPCMVLLCGLVLTVVMGIFAYGDTKFSDDYQLLRNDAGEVDYEATIYAKVDKKTIPITVLFFISFQLLHYKNLALLLREVK